MLLPGVLVLLVYCYIPMGGLLIAFQDFKPAKGLFGAQEWIGLENFKYLMDLPDFWNIIGNTVYIAGMKIVAGLIFPIIVALMLNEVRCNAFKRVSQTLVYLPNFLSWVILAGIFIDLLSPQYGLVNRIIGLFGIEPIYFLGSNKWFPITMVVTDVWKEFGFSTIIYLAALTGIDPTQYEAAIIDGANRWKQTIKITLPGITAVIVLVATLSIGNVLNAGFDQIFNLYSPQVYKSGDIIDTFVYRTGLLEAQYGLATSVGLFKSVVSCLLISSSYYLAYRFADYRIF